MIELALIAALSQQKQPTAQDIKRTGADLSKIFSEAVKPKPGDNLWRPSKVTLTQLAKNTGGATRNLKGTGATIKMIAQTSGGRATFDGVMRIGDNRHYRIDTFIIKPEPLTGIYLNNGTRRFAFVDGKFVPTGGIPSAQQLPSATSDPVKLATLFPSEFGRIMFQGLTDGVDAWGPLFSAWASGVGGYKAKVEERVMNFQGKKYLTYRVIAKRTEQAAKTFGKSTIEVRVDGARFLPVTMMETRLDLKKKPWIVQWFAAYEFGRKFTDSDYAITTKATKK
ncbi:MAG: hypothetical protein ABL949_13280 [Fimbriimonadaceae bacterium]